MSQQVICPTCQGTANRMPILSDISPVDYFKCTDCNGVALSPKDGSGPAIPFKSGSQGASSPRLHGPAYGRP